MFLMKKKRKGVEYLYLVQSVYNSKTRKCERKFIKSFGRYDQVDDDIKRQFENKDERKKLNQQFEAFVRKTLVDSSTNKQIESAPDLDELEAGLEDKLENGLDGSYKFCFGHLVLKPIWESELGLKSKLTYLQKQHTDVTKWSINDLLFYLASTKLFAPMSYLQSSESRTDFFYCPWGNINQDNFYRTLDFVYEHKDDIIKHAYKSHMKKSGKCTHIAFFDCTNTWCETPYDDLVWKAIRYAREFRANMRKEGYTDTQIDALMASEEYKDALDQELEMSSDSFLRMRGMSKEGRYAQPIVSIALAVDEDGFPMDCAVFAGNVSEIHQVEPMIQSLHRKYNLKDYYFVADRGINSTGVLQKVESHGLGYVVAQKVSQQTNAVRNEMLSLDGYKNYQVAEDGSFIECTGPLNPDAPRFKVCELTKVAYVKKDGPLMPGESSRKKISVKCNVVYTFSPDRQAKDLADLEALTRKAQKAVDEKQLISNAYQGWRFIVKTQRDETSKGKQKSADKEQFRAIGLKQDIIDNRRAIAGYTALVFDHPKSADSENLSAVQILDTYHKLVHIEESFRVMKSTLNIRPVYVRLKERIIAHCYICMLSLMMLRSLQTTLAEAGERMSAKRIAQALSSAEVTPLTVAKGEIYFRLLRGPSRFHAQSVTGKGRQEEATDSTTDQSMLYKEHCKQSDLRLGDTRIIFQAAGFPVIPTTVGMNKLKRLLKIPNTNNEKVIASEHIEYIRSIFS